MHRVAQVLVVVCASVALMAQTDQMPKRRPGLWEITPSSAVREEPVDATKVCVDAATDAVLFGYDPGASDSICKTTTLQSDATSITWDIVCTIRGPDKTTVETTHTTIRFAGDAAYHSDSKTRLEPPVVGVSERASANDAKWIGPCPADVQPGDMILPNGLKINLLNHPTRK